LPSADVLSTPPNIGSECGVNSISNTFVEDVIDFYAPQLYRQVLLQRVLAMAILSVCPSVCLSRPGTDSRPGEIETRGIHHMIA